MFVYSVQFNAGPDLEVLRPCSKYFVGPCPPFMASVRGPGKLFGVTPTVFSHRRAFWVWTVGAPNVWSPGLMRSGSILQLV